MNITRRLAVFAEPLRVFAAADPKLEAEVIKALKAHGFVKDKKLKYRWHYKGFPHNKGILDAVAYDLFDKGMRHLGLEPSPARSAHSWFNRDRGILVKIGGQTGGPYYADIAKF